MLRFINIILCGQLLFVVMQRWKSVTTFDWIGPNFLLHYCIFDASLFQQLNVVLIMHITHCITCVA